MRISVRAFPALDGLRGLAAIAVVGFHLGAFADPSRYFSSAYLAVDLFFALSGFVLSYAYSQKLADGMGWKQFMRLRLIRLFPAYLLGVALGTLVYIAIWPAFASLKALAKLILALGCALTFIPMPVPMWERPPIFPLDGPAWSLFFELCVNLCLVCFYRQLTQRSIVAILALSGAILVAIAVLHGNLHVGWNARTLLCGFPRVAFSFFAGVLLQRIAPHGIPRIGLIASVLAVAALIVPVTNHRLYDPAVVLLLFPLAIVAAAGWNLRGVTAKAAEILGDVSYPLYVIHVPCIYLIKRFSGDWDQPGSLTYMLTFAVLIPLSWLIAQFYERPSRRWLGSIQRK